MPQTELLGIDFDDVIVNFNDALRLFHNKQYGTSHHYDDLYTFSLDVLWGCTALEMEERVHAFYRSPEHEMIHPTPGAVEALRTLARERQLVMVTSRPEGVREITELLIEKHVPDVFIETHYLGHYASGSHKKITKGEFCVERGIAKFVDDALHNASSIAGKGVPVILLDRPWNQGELPPLVTRVKHWEEALELLLG